MRKVQGVVEAVKPDEEIEKFEAWGDYRYWLFGFYGTVDHVFMQPAQDYVCMHEVYHIYIFRERASIHQTLNSPIRWSQIRSPKNSLIPNSRSEEFADPEFAVRPPQ